MFLSDRKRTLRCLLTAALLVQAPIALGGCSAAGGGSMSAVSHMDTRQVSEITIRARDGTELRAVLSSPVGRGPFPVVVSVHGGAGDRPIEVMRQAASPESLSPTTQMFNRQPWIILAPDFRSDWMGAEETDIVDAIRYAAELPQADPGRIGVFGGSNGGRLTLRAASLDPAVSSCLAVGSPFLTDPQVFFTRDLTRPPWSQMSPAANAWNTATRQRLEIAVERSARRQGLSTEALVAERSVVSNAGAIRAPVLLITSRADEQVPHVMLESLIDALSQSGRLSKLVTVEASLHGFYWGRDGEIGSREGRGAKTSVQLEEEAQVREAVLGFFTQCFSLSPPS